MLAVEPDRARAHRRSRRQPAHGRHGHETRPRHHLGRSLLSVIAQIEDLTGLTIAERYVVEKCIGQGGMGRVYRALDTRVSRYVAVKVLFSSVAADEKARVRFKKEAEAAGRLAHPNLVSVSDYDEWDGHVFLVMDYVEGVNLADIIYTEAPIPAERTVSLARQLAAGLLHAHERGLIHRDFKPANIIVVREGNEERPRILDFGLAILADTENHRLTTNGLVLGTPAFMSPEQACGEPIDHRSDLFALGLIMYEMLAGKHPFDGTAAAIARQNLAADPPPLRKRAPEAKVPP
ncbi:MAG TPA: serine/threonine-protein kinase, partial [Haliangium sp.]|nr:serine/threonine-protein kinase [Haliangium sp.]